MDEQKKKVLDFIKSQELGVISTVSLDGAPEAAVVGVSEMDDLTLIFGTFNTYRKYKNIKANPNIAFVIGWDSRTIQYEGMARELNGEEREEAETIHIKKMPRAAKFSELSEQCYFKVTPRWIRYTDYTNDGVFGDVFELNF